MPKHGCGGVCVSSELNGLFLWIRDLFHIHSYPILTLFKFPNIQCIAYLMYIFAYIYTKTTQFCRQRENHLELSVWECWFIFWFREAFPTKNPPFSPCFIHGVFLPRQKIAPVHQHFFVEWLETLFWLEVTSYQPWQKSQVGTTALNKKTIQMEPQEKHKKHKKTYPIPVYCVLIKWFRNYLAPKDRCKPAYGSKGILSIIDTHTHTQKYVHKKNVT